MSISYIPEQEDYKKLTPFKRFVLQSFPWIDENFDALNNYELMGKVIEYLNNVISNQNLTNNNVTELYNAMLQFQDYINNYFDNLDVQNEINEKIDEMVEDGTLLSLIAPYIRVIFVDSTSSMTDENKIYVLSSDSHIYQYNETSETFVDTGVEFGSIGSVLTPVSKLVTANNYATNLSDLDNAIDNSIYSLLFAQGVETIPSHMPVSGDSTVHVLFTINTATSKKQIYVSRDNIYTRMKYQNNAWTDWISSNGVSVTRITATNYSSLLPDLDDITINSTYSLLFANSTNAPANLPIEPTGNIEIVQTYNFQSNSAVQLYFCSSDVFYRYKYNNVWRNWNSMKSTISSQLGTDYNMSKILKVGTNETYTTLKSAVEYGVQYPNTIIYVEDGEYDLYEEFGGDTFFDEYTSTSTKGLTLSNGIHLIFSSGAKVVFNNENENTEIDSRFSPFNSGEKGFIIENLNLECSRCRYAIHDERGGSTDQYKNVIINSYLKHDNTQGGYSSTIGGGLGGNGEIIIENCIIESPSTADNVGVISYHNDNSATNTSSKSNVVIKNNYFKEGTIRVSWCGVSTKISNFLINGNYLNSSIIQTPEREIDVIENTSVLDWNNEIAI